MQYIKLIFALLIFAISSCTSDSDFKVGKEQLEAQGYTNIRNTGYQVWCCDERESYSTGFEATTPAGKTVKGCFCSSEYKGVTIRFQ